MKHVPILLTAFALAVPAYAQTAFVPATAPSASNPVPSSSEVESTRGGVRALRASCRDEAKSKGLTGPAKREAASTCVVRQRPDLAGREQCRSEGFGKGLRKEELHAFVKDCAKTKG